MTRKDCNEVFLLNEQYEISLDICKRLQNNIALIENKLKQKAIGEDVTQEMQEFLVKLKNAFNEFEVYL